MTLNTDHREASKTDPPRPDDEDRQVEAENPFKKAFWVEIMKIFTTQYWVVIFTSDDWFIKRMKRAYIVIGLFLPCFFLVLVVIPGLLGRL